MSLASVMLALTLVPAILAAPNRNCLLFCDDDFPAVAAPSGSYASAPQQQNYNPGYNTDYNPGYNQGYRAQPVRQQSYYQPRGGRLENFGDAGMMQQVESRAGPLDIDAMLMHSSSQSSQSATHGFLRMQSRPRPAEPIRQRPCANEYVDPCM